MKVSSTKLRENIYTLLDRVLETGEPLKIQRRGRTLTVKADSPPSRLVRLSSRPTMKTDPDDLVHMDWSGEWRP